VGSFGRKGYHELAYEIMHGKMSYPTVVFIDENLEVIQPIPGFQDAQAFEMIMTFFAGDFYKAVPWKKFVDSFNSENFKPNNTAPDKRQPKVQTVGNGN
jgi:thioredoxin-related protein